MTTEKNSQCATSSSRSKVESLLDLLGKEDQILLADGFDEALIGHAAGMEPRAVYDYDRCISVLVDGGMTYEEAVEFFEFNTVGAYVGEQTPVFIRQMDRDDMRSCLVKMMRRGQMFLDYVQDRLVDEEQATGIRWRSEMSNMMRSLRECKEMLEEGL